MSDPLLCFYLSHAPDLLDPPLHLDNQSIIVNRKVRPADLLHLSNPSELLDPPLHLNEQSIIVHKKVRPADRFHPLHAPDLLDPPLHLDGLSVIVHKKSDLLMVSFIFPAPLITWIRPCTSTTSRLL